MCIHGGFSICCEHLEVEAQSGWIKTNQTESLLILKSLLILY